MIKTAFSKSRQSRLWYINSDDERCQGEKWILGKRVKRIEKTEYLAGCVNRSKTAARTALFAPLCGVLRSRWSSCRARKFGANLPRFWATGKRGCLEQTSARGDFAKCEKYLQVKSRRQTTGRVHQIPAVRRFFASAGEKRLALICVL